MIDFRPAVFLLCIATSMTCTWLLFRSWRRNGARLLFWSSICFVCLSVNNTLVFIDSVTTPDINPIMKGLRLSSSLMAVGVLLWGMVWEAG